MRAPSYKRLKKTLREGLKRHSGKQFWKDVQEKLGDGTGVTDETVDEVVLAMGFQPQWMAKEVKTKKRGQAARRARQMEEDESRGSLEPFVHRPQPVEQPQQAEPQEPQQPNPAASVGAVPKVQPVLNTAGIGAIRGVVPFPKPASLQLPGVVPRVNSAPEVPVPRVVPKPSATLQSLGMALAAPPQQVPPQGLPAGGKPAPAIAPSQMVAAQQAAQQVPAGWQPAPPMPAPPIPGNMIAPFQMVAAQQATQQVPAGRQPAPPMPAPPIPGQ